MKNARAIWMLAVSILLGLVVTAMAVGWVSKRGSVDANKVVVAAVDISLGSRISPQMLTTVDWPSGSVPQGTFSESKDLQERVVKTTIQRGEAILKTKLAPLGTQGGLSAVIAEGKRAMTVRVNDVVGVAGFALPGNYVDVMVNAQQERAGKGEEAKQISKTVLEHVLVLAVAQEAGRDETKPKVVNAVTLELTPDDAERLDLARNIGTLSLVLRNQVDTKPTMTTGITKKQLFGEAEDEPVVKTVTAKPVVKVVHREAPAPASIPMVATLQKNCVEVIHNNTSTPYCF